MGKAKKKDTHLVQPCHFAIVQRIPRGKKVLALTHRARSGPIKTSMARCGQAIYPECPGEANMARCGSMKKQNSWERQMLPFAAGKQHKCSYLNECPFQMGT